MEEFIKKLAVETPLCYEQSKTLVEFIKQKANDLEKAKIIYETDGYLGLMYYVNLLSWI